MGVHMVAPVVMVVHVDLARRAGVVESVVWSTVVN
jgi:hypothetical protein